VGAAGSFSPSVMYSSFFLRLQKAMRKALYLCR
jgi:hypothetical protein